ncbi:MAG: hypothetical protein O7B99_13810 [Planctomycetota bacterium]|nr:hypothetical protein [Planctomycetota bacterium]
MNRTTAILVALATLLAHILAIHQDADGNFGPPHELAHAAYRLARNVVYEGTAAWNVSAPVVESYPSALWIGICSVLTRLHWVPITTATQTIGIVSSLATVVVLAQFSTDRLAGLIALLLLVVTGTTAAAAACGTEMALFTLMAITAYLAFERRWRRTLAVLLCLLVVTRPEGSVLVGTLLVLELVGAKRNTRGGERLLSTFLAPALVLAVVLLVRRWATGNWLSPYARAVVDLDAERIQLGLLYVRSFFFCAGAPTLVAAPLIYAVLGRLSASGLRALAFVLVWSLLAALAGGDGQPFWISMAPMVPFLFLAVQEAMTQAMDSHRRSLMNGSWMLFLLGILASALVSRTPADVGRIPLRKLQIRWMRPPEELHLAYGRMHGRAGLTAEIREVEQLRSVAIFLRDELNVGSSILTPWPGSIGYLSRKNVVDMRGRTTPPPGEPHLLPWQGMQRVDLARMIEQKIDYVVLGAVQRTPRDVAETWIEKYDTQRDRDGRLTEILQSLDQRYELVSVPVPIRSDEPDVLSPHPFYLLRSKDLELSPRIELEQEPDGSFVVLSRHRGHEQVVDLEIELAAPDGTEWHLRPTGEFVQADPVRARTSVLLYAGRRPIHLIRFTLPEDFDRGLLEAVLHNPGRLEESPFSRVGKPSRLAIDR